MALDRVVIRGGGGEDGSVGGVHFQGFNVAVVSHHGHQKVIFGWRVKPGINTPVATAGTDRG